VYEVILLLNKFDAANCPRRPVIMQIGRIYSKIGLPAYPALEMVLFTRREGRTFAKESLPELYVNFTPTLVVGVQNVWKGKL
jgi:hypothetical protein